MTTTFIGGYIQPSTGGTIYLHNLSEKTDDGVQILTTYDTIREPNFRPTLECRTLDASVYPDLLACVGNDDDGDPITVSLYLWNDAVVAHDMVLVDNISHTRMGVWHIIKFTLEPYTTYSRTGYLRWDGGEIKLENLPEDTDDGLDILSNSTILLSGKKNIQVSGDYYITPAIEIRTKDPTVWSTLLTRLGVEDDGTPKKNQLELFGSIYDNMILTGRMSRKRYKEWFVISFQLEQQTAA